MYEKYLFALILFFTALDISSTGGDDELTAEDVLTKNGNFDEFAVFSFTNQFQVKIDNYETFDAVWSTKGYSAGYWYVDYETLAQGEDDYIEDNHWHKVQIIRSNGTTTVYINPPLLYQTGGEPPDFIINEHGVAHDKSFSSPTWDAILDRDIENVTIQNNVTGQTNLGVLYHDNYIDSDNSGGIWDEYNSPKLFKWRKYSNNKVKAF